MSQSIDANDLIYDGEPAEALPYYVALGRLCVVWGPLESMVSALAVLSYHNFPHHRPQRKGGKGDANPPESFSSKIAMVSKSLESVAPGEEFQSIIRPLLEDLLQASDQRNILLHTNWSQIWSATDSAVAQGHRIKSSGGSYQVISGKASIDDLLSLTEHLGSLTTRMLPLMFRGILNQGAGADGSTKSYGPTAHAIPERD